MRKRTISYVSHREDGTVDHVNIPMQYVYMFLAATVVGMFTIAGLAGSYTRMLVKAETINHLRDELAMSRSDYAHLEKSAHEKDVQVASLGSLATEVSAIYGLTGHLALPGHALHLGGHRNAVLDAAKAPLKDNTANFSDASYYRSLDTFYALKNAAAEDLVVPGGIVNPNLGVRSELDSVGGLDVATGSNVPDLWPVMGPIDSGFGERIDPVLGGGVGEFHKGVDIGAPDGTPIHAPAAGRVIKASVGNGYGREIEIDHGNGIVTLYAHLGGYNVTVGESVVKGQVIGYVGRSGKTTGRNLHYEVQVHGVPVNPHRYLRETMAQLGGSESVGSGS